MIDLNPMICIRPQDDPHTLEFTMEADRGTIVLTLEALDRWAIARANPAFARLLAMALVRIADEADRQGGRAGSACESDGKGGGI